MSIIIKIHKNHFIENINNVIAMTDCTIFPVLKLNAYGHGFKQIIFLLMHHCPKIERISVAYTYEALECIALGWKGQIVIMADSLNIIFHPQCEYFLLSSQMLDRVIELNKLRQNIKMHIKCDVGLNRFGFLEKDLPYIISKIKNYGLIDVIGICSHLPATNYIMEDEVFSQIKSFENMVNIIEYEFHKVIQYKHLFGSRGINLIKKYDIKCCNAVRVGGAIYGLLKTEQQEIIQKDFPNIVFKQILTLQTPIMEKKMIKYDRNKKNFIGYGRNNNEVNDDTYYFICCCGYGNGFYTVYDGNYKIAGYYKGKYLELCAIVSMNNTFLKVSPELYKVGKIGDYVTLSSWGIPHLLAADLSVGRPYMFFATLNSNIEREIV